MKPFLVKMVLVLSLKFTRNFYRFELVRPPNLVQFCFRGWEGELDFTLELKPITETSIKKLK